MHEDGSGSMLEDTALGCRLSRRNTSLWYVNIVRPSPTFASGSCSNGVTEEQSFLLR